MAERAEVDWYNPITGEYEKVNGWRCNCFNCEQDAILAGGYEWYLGGIPFSQKEYRQHLAERSQAYHAWKASRKPATVKPNMAHTKETGSEEDGVGLPSSSVPTFFDLEIGELILPDDSRAHSYRMRRLESI